MGTISTELRIALAQAIELAEVERVTPTTLRAMQEILDNADKYEVPVNEATGKLLARAQRFVRSTGEALDRGMERVQATAPPAMAGAIGRARDHTCRSKPGSFGTCGRCGAQLDA